MFSLRECVLVKSFGIRLQLACGSSFSEEVPIAVLELHCRLATVVIEQVCPDRQETSNKPQVIVATNKPSVEGNAYTCCVSYGQGNVLPSYDRRGLFGALVIVRAVVIA